MAKQRNSLGVLVLPLPGNDGPITWEQYKERYGIDLDEILQIANTGSDETPSFSVLFRRDFRKLIALSYKEDNFNIAPCVSFPTLIVTDSSSTISEAFVSLEVIDRDSNGGYSIVFNGNRTVQGGDI